LVACSALVAGIFAIFKLGWCVKRRGEVVNGELGVAVVVAVAVAVAVALQHSVRRHFEVPAFIGFEKHWSNSRRQ
jgi:hypothetical protein